MVALSDRKLEIVKTLVESAPDKIVGGLQRALSESSGDTRLASVRRLVESEASDRVLRNLIFQPVAPLCVGDGSDKRSLVFPARALGLIWRGLKSLAPNEMEAAATVSEALATAIAGGKRPPDPDKVFDAVVAAAASALRAADQRDFGAAAQLCDRARPGGAEALAACLDIAPVVRRALPRLADWVAHPGEDTGAAARLAYKDAVAIAEDAGPRFFEMLAGQLTPPWMVLRIISSIMDQPTERFLADSELGGFAERVMDDIDETLKATSRLDLDAGPRASRAAAARIELITQQVFELETCIELTRESGWGHRILGEKKALANIAEARLRDAEKLVVAALPVHPPGFSRPRKTGPNLEAPPEPRTVGRAITLLAFADEIRHTAPHGGFSATHAKIMEKLWDVIERYTEDLLSDVRNGDAKDLVLAHAYLTVAADMAGLVHGEKAAELVRRRASAACLHPEATVILDA